MLEPEHRHLLLDSLRPPVGFVFDAAVGTTFSLDLVALLVTPVAFALFDVEGEHGGPLANPMAVLEAVRRHASRISIYCQAGQIVPPASYRAAYAYLEDAVVPVTAPRKGGLFHPKTWLIRFRRTDGAVRYRFLCLSRNLTFDRSWDTVLRLDGEQTTEQFTLNAPLAEFIRLLPGMATAALPPRRAALTRSLADEVRTVRWDSLPDGLSLEAFWPLGHDGQQHWPFPESPRRMLVISPFVSLPLIERLCQADRRDVLVTRPETLDRLGRGCAAYVHRTCVLQSMAVAGPSVEGPTTEPDHVVDTEESGPQGLHAKLFVADEPWWSRIWTGSANATLQAFTGNVEFLVELKGRNNTHGVASLVEPGPPGQMRLGNLLEDYTLPVDSIAESAAEVAERRLDSLAHAFGALTYRANVVLAADDLFDVTLVGTGAVPTMQERAGVRIGIRPLAVPKADLTLPQLDGRQLRAAFRSTFVGLTAFFAIHLGVGSGEDQVTRSFLVTAELVGVPEDRLERLLASEIHSRSDLIRLLLLLLGHIDPEWGFLEDLLTGNEAQHWRRAGVLGSEALLEPILRSVSRDPGRLDEIERLVNELARTPEGMALLPEGWAAVWRAVSSVRPASTKAQQ